MSIILQKDRNKLYLLWPTWIFCWLPGSYFTILFKVVVVVLSKFIETRDSHRNLRQIKISLVSSAAIGGWLIVRECIQELFGSCKDPQHMMFVNLLDEISCFNFYFYTTCFRGWLFWQMPASFNGASMMLFITFKRRNYDKATLCQLNDVLFHVSDNHVLALEDRIQQFLQTFTEKKIEIQDSILRRYEGHKIIITTHSNQLYFVELSTSTHNCTLLTY